MSLPATQNDLPLSPRATDEARKPLGILFAAYPEPWSDKSASHAKELIDAKVSAYLMAVQGVPGWAVEQAVTDFVQGLVDRRGRHKLPAAEELAAVARQHLEKERDRQLAKQREAEQIKESREWAEKQRWLQTEEGQEHQRQRAKRAAEIMKRHGLRPMPTDDKTAE